MIFHENDVIVNGSRRYQIQGKIGSESTFGAVFKALDNDSRPVVVKQLLSSDAITRDTGMDYDYTRQTFEREAHILTSHNHPQIVKGLDFFEYDGSLILIMEFINGEDLDQALIKKIDRDGQPFSEGEVLPIAIALCNVIHAIHQLPGQVLYRDLKPRNVMWDAQARSIKIIDFGTARFSEQDKHPTQALGTPGYAPPELYVTNQPLSFAADVYTIGATIYELVTGEMAEPLMTPATYHGRESLISKEFRGIIAKSMSRLPKDRYQTAADMAIALSRLAGADSPVSLETVAQNPYPYLSCLCTQCGAQPRNNSSLFCNQCGGKIHVMILRIQPASDDLAPMDLFLDKAENLIGRADMEEDIFPDIDLARYDPDCYVSRRHCYLRREGTRFFIEPLKTTNHTAINGYPLSAGHAVPINAPTEIQLANLKVSFICKPCMEA